MCYRWIKEGCLLDRHFDCVRSSGRVCGGQGIRANARPILKPIVDNILSNRIQTNLSQRWSRRVQNPVADTNLEEN
jgi:hypothetical protein